MGVGRMYRGKGVRRPKKSALDRRRRQKVQRKRLVALGVEAVKVEKMNPKVVRDMLKRPKKLVKTMAKAKAKKALKQATA